MLGSVVQVHLSPPPNAREGGFAAMQTLFWVGVIQSCVELCVPQSFSTTLIWRCLWDDADKKVALCVGGVAAGLALRHASLRRPRFPAASQARGHAGIPLSVNE